MAKKEAALNTIGYICEEIADLETDCLQVRFPLFIINMSQRALLLNRLTALCRQNQMKFSLQLLPECGQKRRSVYFLFRSSR
jgi:hypothetical protein